MQVASAIADNTAELCEHCGLTTNHITDGAFQCFVQNAHEVTFRARLHSSPTSTPMELINHIIYWIENGASIAINGILLSVDQSCDIVIESFSEHLIYLIPYISVAIQKLLDIIYGNLHFISLS